MRFDLIGLHESHLTVAAGEGTITPAHLAVQPAWHGLALPGQSDARARRRADGAAWLARQS